MDVIVCRRCNSGVKYNKDDTIYLKCRYCNKVLIDVKIKEEHLGEAIMINQNIVEL